MILITMSDYMIIDTPDNLRNIFVKDLIAFFPKQGYIICEGYNYNKKDVLPFKTKVIRSQPQAGVSVLFNIEVVDFYKKDMLPPSFKYLEEKVEHYCDPDICGCSIRFFANDIHILKFNILDSNNPWTIDWTYCIDNRFKTPEELIERYKGLSDSTCESYDDGHDEDHNEDQEFYDGYYIVSEAYDDMYIAQYDAIPDRSAEVIQNFQKNKVRSNRRVQQLSILPILTKWGHLYNKVIATVDKSAVDKSVNAVDKSVNAVDKSVNADDKSADNKAFLKAYMDMLEFLESDAATDTMTKWCAEYLYDSTLHNKLEGWLRYGIKNASKTKEFEKFWQLFFRRQDNQPDIVELGSCFKRQFDISYPQYVSMLESKKTVGEESEPQETSSESSNIFMNKDKVGEFIWEWLKAVDKMPEEEQNTINYIWPPVQPYSIDVHKQCITGETLPEFISNLYKIKERVYYEGDTTKQLDELRASVKTYSVPYRLFKRGSNQFNEIFLFLSHILSYMPYMICADKRRVLGELKEVRDLKD